MTQNDNNIISDKMKREAEIEKEMGNKHFKSGNISEAIECYSKAIKLFPLNAVFYCNRSIAYFKKGLVIEAENDCNLAINIDSNYVKGYYRRGIARKQLNRFASALHDFNHVLKLDPNNKEAKREIDSIESLIKSKAIIDVKPIVKQIEFQSNKPLVNIPIIEDNSLKISKFEVKLPQNLPKTYYQFESDWRQLTGIHSMQLRLKYLEMIGSDLMKKLFSSTFEPQIMSDIIITLSNSNDSKFVLNILNHMIEIPRFETLVLFLSETDKQTLKSIFERLKCDNFLSDKVSEIANRYLLSL